jgi:hypothetical protein
MEVSVKKGALKEFIKNSLKENRTYHSGEIDQIPAKEDDDFAPIEPSEQVAVQLSTEKPPVEDPSYVPVSHEELSLSASVIAKEVPTDEIEYFYRMLHKLLDKTLDRYDKAEFESLQEAMGSSVEDDDDEDLPEIGEEEYDRPLSIEDPVQRVTDEILDYFHKPDVFESLVYKKMQQNIAHQGELFKFPVRFARFKSEAPAIAQELFAKDRVKRVLLDLDSVQRRAVLGDVYTYIITFLKDPERVSDEDISIGNASKKIDVLLKKAENNPEEFKKLLDAAVKEMSEKDKKMSGMMVLVGASRLSSLLAGEDPSISYEYDDESDDEVQDAEAEEEEVEQEEKESAIDTWTRIAKEEGFASAAGARQYAFKPTLKMFLQSEVLLNNTMDIVISKASRAFRREVQALVTKGKLDSNVGRDLMSKAKIGPGITGNETFREFFGVFFYQPFINKVLSTWEDKIQNEILAEMGVSDPKRTLTKMINGETKANLKKIEKLMSMSDFRKARSEARNWIQNSKGMNKFARDFMDAQLKSKTKAKNVLGKVLAKKR